MTIEAIAEVDSKETRWLHRSAKIEITMPAKRWFIRYTVKARK